MEAEQSIQLGPALSIGAGFAEYSQDIVGERIPDELSEYSVISPSLLRDRRCLVPAPFHTESLFLRNSHMTLDRVCHPADRLVCLLHLSG
jgi:hypothetical protein